MKFLFYFLKSIPNIIVYSKNLFHYSISPNLFYKWHIQYTIVNNDSVSKYYSEHVNDLL
jgi:hypothetical protein